MAIREVDSARDFLSPRLRGTSFPAQIHVNEYQ